MLLQFRKTALLPTNFDLSVVAADNLGPGQDLALVVTRLDSQLALLRVDVDVQPSAWRLERLRKHVPLVLTGIKRQETVAAQHGEAYSAPVAISASNRRGLSVGVSAAVGE